jgi:hypothetical protein
MAKYYIQSGTLHLIYSTDKPPLEAAAAVLWESNKDDTLHEYFYVDERGFRDYSTAQPDTIVLPTEAVVRQAKWTIS